MSSAPAPNLTIVKRRRRGFTLVELLVALILLDFGLIALAGASAAVSRVNAGAQSDRRALELTVTRVERTLAQPCAGAAAGIARPAPGVVEWWVDTPAPNGVRYASDSLQMATSRGPHVVVLHAAGRC